MQHILSFARTKHEGKGSGGPGEEHFVGHIAEIHRRASDHSHIVNCPQVCNMGPIRHAALCVTQLHSMQRLRQTCWLTHPYQDPE